MTAAKKRKKPTAAPELEPDEPLLVMSSEIEPEEIEWLMSGYLPWGKLVIIEGDPGVGKSLLTLDLAATISTGGQLPNGQRAEKGAVLLLSLEDGRADTAVPRLGAAGADRMVVAFGAAEGDEALLFSMPSGAVELVKAIEQLKTDTGRRRVAVFIDPIMGFIDRGLSPNDDADVRRVTNALAHVAAHTGALVVVVRHHAKSSQVQSALYKGLGSIAWSAAARSVLAVGVDHTNRDRLLMVPVKQNISARQPALAYSIEEVPRLGVPKLTWHGAVDVRADEVFIADARKHAPSRDEAVRLLERLLEEHCRCIPARVAQRAAEQAGIALIALDRARVQLSLGSYRGRENRRRWYWVPSDEVVEDHEVYLRVENQ